MLWVYVGRKGATLHRGGCEDCNEGQGKVMAAKTGVRWLGPFEELADARASVDTPLKECRKCRPGVDW